MRGRVSAAAGCAARQAAGGVLRVGKIWTVINNLT
jgi:hypothetical protein